MQRSPLIPAGLLVVIGATFIGQGTGILRGSSFMVGDGRWAVIGLVLLIVGLALGWRAVRRTRR
ncbi:MAG: hypothetical protein M3067_04580 [Chloroflexota bacterium]|nr:hypothetical protein [Chloroflexota bacterium]